NLRVHICPADLSRDEDLERLADALQHDAITVDFLINNAGVGDRGDFATSEPQRLKDIALVNIISVTLLTRQLLPPMIERRRGAILNVSSSASFLPIPRMAVYAASKAYVTSLSEALRSEVAEFGITVTALCPGPVHTEFDTVAMRPHDPKRKAPEFTYVPVEEVVRAALDGVERNRPIIIPGVAMKVAMLFARLLPMPVLRLASRLSP
ncbi:MAG TPA: SDR family NAD(P)-dependent oxidoreductase, partial [Chthoniobacterales bacterium]|nr:SDR family NAD(P)-dependent oxidoreductase [Chthoniobacterales bacterium]